MAASVALMAEALTVGIGGHDGCFWEWRYVQLDASDAGVRRDHLFAAVPRAAEACVRAAGDLGGRPESRFWFLLADEVPILSIEPSAGRRFVGGAGFDVGDPAAERAWRLAVSTTQSASPDAPPMPATGTPTIAFGLTAKRLAKQIAPGLVRFPYTKPVTTLAEWFTDADDIGHIVIGASGSAERVTGIEPA